jgi:hypothetical protein
MCVDKAPPLQEPLRGRGKKRKERPVGSMGRGRVEARTRRGYGGSTEQARRKLGVSATAEGLATAAIYRAAEVHHI